MSMLWTVETDALAGAAQAVTGQSGWGMGGRLGSEWAGGHATALDAVQALIEAGHRAWIEPAAGSDADETARAGLQAYAAARRGLLEAVHAGLEADMTKTRMTELSGLSRPGLDKIIARYGLAELVRGN